MRKFLILLLFISSTFNSVKAEQLVLSDIIQETRNRILMQEAKEKAELAMKKSFSKKDIECKDNLNKQLTEDKSELSEITKN